MIDTTATSTPPTRRRRPARVALTRTIALLAALLTVVMLAGRLPGPWGTAIATALPWLGLALVPLFVVALFTRRGALFALVPVLVWVLVVGQTMTWFPRSASAADADHASITFAAQNVEVDSGTSGESAANLVDAGADVIALTELNGAAREDAAAALAATHPYSYTVGTVGVWSTLPLSEKQPLDLDLGWYRALSAEIETAAGPLTVYVVHAASLRPGEQNARDAMLSGLAAEITQNDAERVVALGDFNAAGTDPALDGIRAELSEPPMSTVGFGFTWPAVFPLARIDHVFQRGLTPVSNDVLRAGNSDHLAVVARLLL